MKVIKARDFLLGKHDDLVKEELEKGNVIIFPSESSYGLAGNALSQKVVNKIHQAKKEDNNKPIGVITDDIKKVESLINIDKKGKKLLKIFSKPITVIFKAKKSIPANKNNVLGVRIPLNIEANHLCSLVNFPLTAIAANINGNSTIYDSSEIKKVFSSTKFVLIDAGKLEVRAPSTYYDFENKLILRAGEISITEINSAFK